MAPSGSPQLFIVAIFKYIQTLKSPSCIPDCRLTHLPSSLALPLAWARTAFFPPPHLIISFLFFLSFFFFLLFRASLMAYGGPQARGRIGTVATGLHTTATAMQDSSLVCDLHHTSRQCRIPNPLSKARDGTRNLVNTSRIHFYCASVGTPNFIFLFFGF